MQLAIADANTLLQIQHNRHILHILLTSPNMRYYPNAMIRLLNSIHLIKVFLELLALQYLDLDLNDH